MKKRQRQYFRDTAPSASVTRRFAAAAVMLLALGTISTGLVSAKTNTIGSFDGTFESGLGGSTQTGTTELVNNVGSLQAIEGSQSLLLSNPDDDGALISDIDSSTVLIENFTIDPAYDTLRLTYNFLTNEPGPSFANDTATVTLILGVGDEQVVLASDTFDSFFDAPWTGAALQTGYRTMIADVSSVNDGATLVSLELRIDDVGDGRRDSAIMIDDVRLVEPGAPEAIVKDAYITIDPGDPFIFDGTMSMDDTGIAEYNWTFGNGFFGSGPLINMTGYTEQGMFQGSLTVVDDDGNTDTTYFSVIVGDINSGPQITSSPNTSASEEVPYRYQPAADDAQLVYGDTLTWSLDTAPAGMAVDPGTGLLTWTPPAGAPQSTDVTLRVVDSFGEVDLQSYSILLVPEVYVAAMQDDGRFYTSRSLGDGTFDTFTFIDDLGTGTHRGIVMGDFDGDTDYDVIATQPASPTDQLFLYTRENGSFEPPVYLGPVGSGSASLGATTEDMAAEDFNNDGRTDVVIQGDSAYTYLLENTGPLVTQSEDLLATDFETGEEGWFTNSSTTLTRDDTTSSSGDWSMHVTAPAAGSNLYAELNPADWSFPLGSTISFDYRIPPGTPVGVWINVDVLSGGWLVIGGTDSRDTATWPVSPNAVTLIDDGNWHSIEIDLYDVVRSFPGASTSSRGRRFEFWTNGNTTATDEFWFDNFRISRPRMVSGFTNELLPATGGNGRGIDAADADNDGNMDFVRARTSSGYLYLYDGDGDGNFTPSTSQVADPGGDPYGVVFKDFDNDGTPDIIANNSSSGDGFFFKGAGDGSFSAPVKVLDSNNYSSLAAYDFNGDGNVDVVATNYTSRQGLFFAGNGDSTFQPASQFATFPSNTLSVAAPAGRALGQPFALATQSATEVDTGEAVDFDGSASFDDSSIVSYEWDFGDGNMGSGETASHAYAVEGDYVVVLTVTDDEGFTDRAGLNVRAFGALPVADPGGPYALDEDDALLGNFYTSLDGTGSTDAEADIASWEWDLDASDGISVDATGPAPRVSFPGVGSYTVTLTVYDQVGQSSSDTVVVTASGDTPPVADLSGPVSLGEAGAAFSRWTGWYDGAASTDAESLAALTLDWGDGNSTTVAPMADDFNDGNFNGWTVSGGTWSVIDGELAQTNTGGAWRWMQDLDRSYQDFQLEVDFMGVSTGDGYMGIVFRNPNTSGSTNTYLMYARNSWDFWRFYDWNTGAVLSDADGIGADDGTAPGWDPGAWYHLRLVVQGNTMQLYVTPEGGTEVLANEYTDPNNAHPFGGIGLVSNAHNVRYDNVKVTPLDTDWRVGGAGLTDLGHTFDAAQVYDVTLTATDHAGQTDTDTLNVETSLGAPPVAALADPGVLGEADANYGRWNLVVDAGGSSDDERIERYTVDFGDGTSYTAGVGNGLSSQYFAVGTDLYGFDVGDGEIEQVIAMEDNTLVELINLDNGAVIASNTINRLQTWANVNPGNGTYFKLQATKPVAAYLTDFANHSAFMPSLDGSPVGREFIYYHDQNQGMYYYAAEDSLVSVYSTSGAVVSSFTLLAGEYRSVSFSNAVYRVDSSGRISIQVASDNGYTTVPAANGDGVGRSFLFATYTGGAISAFAHAAANIEVFDLDTGASLYTASIAAGTSWYQTGMGTRRLRLESDADIEVWAGDYEASTNAADMGDDISFAGGREGTEFVLHTLRDGVVIFAPSDATDITINGAAVATLPRDGYLQLAPTDFPGGLGVYTVEASKPIVIQTLGRSNVFNDLGTYLGGVTLRHWYDAQGSYTVTLTVTDSVGQTDTTTQTVEVTAGDPPVPLFSAPDVAGESFADGGIWSVDFDAGASTDDDRIATFEWDFGDGTTGTGQTITHTYDTPGTYTTSLTVTDHAGQSVTLDKDIEITFGGGPVADSGGPYTFGEEAAGYGVWTATLDGTASTDDNELFDYLWQFEGQAIDDFNDNSLDDAIWEYARATEADGVLKISGTNFWGSGFFYSDNTIQRDIQVKDIEIKVTNTVTTGNARMMVGLFNETPASSSYVQMPHAVYFNNGSLQIYENGSYRGNFASYTRGSSYDIRISLKATGADYYYRPSGTTSWILLWQSPNGANKNMRPGASILDSSWEFDDVTFGGAEVFGPVITRDYFMPGVQAVTLRVRDQALQEDFDSTTITIVDGDAPVAVAGGPYTAEVGSFINFNGTGSSDDTAIQLYDWTFGDTTGGPAGAGGSASADLPFRGRGPTPRHFYQAVGSYTAELTVTDNTGKSHSASSSVNVIVGNPPTAAMAAPSAGAANGPPVYFDGTDSIDDFGVVEYRWDFDADADRDGDGDPTNDIDAVGATPFHTFDSDTAASASTLLADDFAGPLDSGTWITSGVTQDTGAQVITGASSWGNRYSASVENFTRGRRSVTAEITQTRVGSGAVYTMWGLKNTGTSYSYTQMPHAIYFVNGTLQIYENGSNRGTVGSYTVGTTYQTRIDLKAAGGADYYIRELGAPAWTQLTSYTPTGTATTPLKVHTTVNQGTTTIDNVVVSDAGPYVVTLTVADGAGQTSSFQQSVEIADNLPPNVLTPPWVAFDPLVPHETYNGKSIRLKGIVRDADPVSYQWDFGDGNQSGVISVTNKYDLSIAHTYPDAPTGTPFTATLSVTDSAGNVGTATYPVIVRPLNLNTEINIAIDEGLWYLHQQQTRSTAEGYQTGFWTSNARASATASAIQAFEINGHLETTPHRDDPYAETVERGLRQLFRDLGTVNIATQTYGEPDTNANGIGVQTGVNSSGNQPIYQGGQVMDAIASSGTPLRRTLTGATGIKRRSYFDVLTDMSDQFAWGQTEQGSGGSWRYSWNSSIDNSAAQWGAIGMLASEDIFGIPVPLWVKERNEVWLNRSYNGTGYGYTTGSTSRAGTPSGLVQMTFAENTTGDGRWVTAEAWMANNWTNQYIINEGNRPYYPYYALTKSMRLAEPEPVEKFLATGLDWFRDADLGLARTLIDDQQASGLFPGSEWISGQLRSAWGVIILSRTLFVQPPVADAGRDRVWGVDRELTFDGSGSFHLDPFRSLVQYEWDFDGDGIFDSSSSEPTATYTYAQADYPADELPQTIIVSLRVTDNNSPALTDTDTAEIIVAIPPHPPIAEAGGPYTCTAGLPCQLDGSGSFDIDPTDFIARYEWDLDGFPFDYDGATGETPSPVFAEGVHDIGLRVWDNGVLNDLDGDDEVDENERLSDVDFAQVTAVPNQPPEADLSGPTTVDEGSSILLDASASIDPNGDPLSYAWDLDNDGVFDDAIGPTYNFLGVDDGDVPIAVEVTDGLLTDTAALTVTVLNVDPSVDAGPGQTVPEGSTVSFNGSFTDPGTADTHTIEWDFGDGNVASGSLTPSNTYAADGIYTVTLTVTDDDGGVGSDTLEVTVTDGVPIAALTGDTPLNEGDTGNYDASASTSPVDPIVLYEWDWDYDGTFDPSGDTGATQSHLFLDDGAPVVAVRVTDSDGSTDIATLPVTVVDLGPTAAVTGDTGLIEGDTGSYDATGSTSSPDAIVLYEWDYEYDGTFSASGDTGVTTTHTWVDDGDRTVAVRVTDDDGSSDIATFDVSVANAAPVVEAGPDNSTLVDTPIALAPSTFTDLGLADTHTATVNWGDGSPVDTPAVTQGAGSGSVAQSHTYTSAGTYTVTVTVTDDEGAPGSDTLEITVTDPTNVPPVVNAPDDSSIDEGDTYSDSGLFQDADSSSFTATVDYGDGSGVQPLAFSGPVSGVGSYTLNHTYPEDGSYTITVTVMDEVSTSSDAVLVTVNNVAPIVDAGLDQSGLLVTDTVSLDPATFTDAGVQDTHTAAIDWGDGSSVEPGAVTQGAGSGSVAGSHDYAAPGIYTVIVTVTDDEGDAGSDTLTVTISEPANQDPVVDAGNGDTISEGDSFSGSGSFTDATGDSWTATVDYGDGSGSQALALNPDKSFSLSHTYPEDGSYTVTVTVDDDRGGRGSDTLTVIVDNEAPVVEAGADQAGVAPSDAVNLDPATFTDAGILDTHTATIDWGDGSGPQPAGVGAGNTVPGSYSYGAAGSYTVTVTVTDDEGDSGSDTLQVTVEDAGPRTCDIDLDGNVDIADINLIFAARNQPALPDDPRDLDGDGIITVLDGRICVLQCDLARCAPVPD